MLNINEIDLIKRYINGNVDAIDTAFVESLFSEGVTNSGLRNNLEKEWERDSQNDVVSEVVLNSMLDRVHHLIRNKENLKKKRFISRFVHTFSKVAAILILPLLMAGGLTFGYLVKSSDAIQEQFASTVIHAPMGSRISFNLPDGTSGWLNSGSSLTYNIPFTNNRQVNIEGEGWFDVAHDQKHPFEVSAGSSKIKVLGTSFNISAYPESEFIEIVLQQGKVDFYQDIMAEKITMAPSQKLVFSKGEINIVKTDPYKYKSWTEGKLVFRGDNMAEVARRIERWYNVKVILADQELEKYSFRATFEDDSLEEVLRLLGMTSPIDYQIAPRIINTDGTIEKLIVSLYKRGNKKGNN